jgi:outer membrane protein assembly factor BamB
MDSIFIGIKGTVVAVDRETCRTLWKTDLKGADVVNVTLQDGDLFAACRGRLYRLDSSTGVLQWCNELPGLGYGLVSIAGAPQAPPFAGKRRREQQAAGAAAAGSRDTGKLLVLPRLLLSHPCLSDCAGSMPRTRRAGR